MQSPGIVNVGGYPEVEVRCSRTLALSKQIGAPPSPVRGVDSSGSSARAAPSVGSSIFSRHANFHSAILVSDSLVALAPAGNPYAIPVVDVHTTAGSPSQLVTVCTHHTASVQCLCAMQRPHDFSSQIRFASGGADRSVRVWDSAEGKELASVTNIPGGGVTALLDIPWHNWICESSSAHRKGAPTGHKLTNRDLADVRCWDSRRTAFDDGSTSQLQLVRCLEAGGDCLPMTVFSLEHAPSMQAVFAGGSKGRVRMWDFRQPTFISQTRVLLTGVDGEEEGESTVAPTKKTKKKTPVVSSAFPSSFSSAERMVNGFAMALRYVSGKNALLIQHRNCVSVFDVRMFSNKQQQEPAYVIQNVHPGRVSGFYSCLEQVSDDTFVSAMSGGTKGNISLWSLPERRVLHSIDRPRTESVCFLSPISGSFSLWKGSSSSATAARGYGEISDEESERIESLCDDQSFGSFRLVLDNGSCSSSLTLPKVLLHSCVIANLDDIDEFYLSEESLYLPETGEDLSTTFVQLLLGVIEELPKPALILTFYSLFLALGLPKHAYLVCSKCASFGSVEEFLWLLEVVLKRRNKRKQKMQEEEGEGEGEDDEKEDIPNLSGVTLACFNLLRRRYLRKFQTEMKLTQQASRLRILTPLLDHAVTPLHRHRDFVGTFRRPQDVRMSFLVLGRELLSELHTSPRFSDMTIRTFDSCLFRAHLPILSWKFNFFNSLIRFGGSDLSSSSEIDVDIVSGSGMAAMLQWAYLSRMPSDATLSILIPIIAHAHAFMESRLTKSALAAVQAISVGLKRDGTLESELLPVGYHFRDEEAFWELRAFWASSGTLSEEKLTQVVEKSCVEHRVEIELFGLRDRVAAVEKTLVRYDARFDSFEKQLSEIKELLLSQQQQQ